MSPEEDRIKQPEDQLKIMAARADNMVAYRDKMIQQARAWVANCVDPLSVGPDKKNEMLKYLNVTGHHSFTDELAAAAGEEGSS